MIQWYSDNDTDNFKCLEMIQDNDKNKYNLLIQESMRC
jgi:hypothetical protein